MKCARCGRELPTEFFRKTRWVGVRSTTCNECFNQLKQERRAEKMQEVIAEASTKRLEDFTPRELMVELARRGFKGTLEFTQTRVIDIQRL